MICALIVQVPYMPVMPTFYDLVAEQHGILLEDPALIVGDPGKLTAALQTAGYSHFKVTGLLRSPLQCMRCWSKNEHASLAHELPSAV